MQRLAGQHVVVGVGGSVAAYRACDVIRRLRELGATLRVAPTRGAQAFITPLTLEALSGAPCLLTSLDIEHGRIPHVEEGHRAHCVVVAPASADLLAKMATGFADEALLSLLLSFRGPLVLAPAMETHMWEHPATQENVRILRARGALCIGPVEGPLASGRNGSGRLAHVDDIVEGVVAACTKKDLTGRRIVVTAGPTVEDIDPVRFLTNRSSGKMGVLVAREAALRGAQVELVHGPLKSHVPSTPGLVCHPVRSAEQMRAATLAIVDSSRSVDAAILAAAVADSTPQTVAVRKLKKSEGGLVAIDLTPTVDILASLGSRSDRAFALIGFAAETHDVERYAEDKRVRKNCDLIVGNDVSAPDSGFDVDTNRIYLARAHGSAWLPLASKEAVAQRVIDELRALLR